MDSFQCLACADPNVVSDEGYNAHDYAMVAANLKIAEWLSEQGAEPSGKPLPGTRCTANAQKKHPPEWAPADKGYQKGRLFVSGKGGY